MGGVLAQVRQFLSLIVLFGIVAQIPIAEAVTLPKQFDFDHLTTGYPLIGRHEFVPCESCHSGGVFKGTPKQCNGCHNSTVALGKSKTHIVTTAQCDACHSLTTGFAVSARMDHSTTTAACGTCHNTVNASGKPANHIVTTLDCASCHSTAGWKVSVGFDHSGIGNATCVSCHNGTTATGKPAGHISTTDVCNACHSTGGSFKPVLRVDHNEILNVTNCSSCHNGTTATGKGVNHIPTQAQCSGCHTTTAWSPTTFNHQGITGNCVSCHNGTDARGKSATHVNSTNVCEACHSPSTNWTVQRVDHQQVVGTCISCHLQDKGPRHIPTDTKPCDICHTTNAWTPTRFDHSSAQIGTKVCFDCHNGGSDGRGKGPQHIASSNSCQACHQPNTNWAVQAVDHTQVVGTCTSCHAQEKGPTHIPTTLECSVCHSTTAWSPTQFDHSPAQIGTKSCFDCHNGTSARGKGRTHIASTNLCSACHAPNTNWVVTTVDHTQVQGSCASAGCHAKPNGHINTTNRCEACHSTITFKPAVRTDHLEVVGSCASTGCHSGAGALGLTKPSTHINTTNRCEACHSTLAFQPAVKVDHLEVIGACSSCHTKPNTHMNSTNNCDACHDPAPKRWTPAIIVDHREIPQATSGQCTACHSKPTVHPNTTNNCVRCHANGPPGRWSPALRVDHNEVVGTCGQCHNGTDAKGKGTNHFIYTGLECNNCHTTTAWKPSTAYHNGPVSGGYPGTHWFGLVGQCARCHKQNNAVIAYPSANPDCAACHTNDYRPGDHGGRPISQRSNCGQSGCHRVNSRSF